jgi:hypothetical protein
MLTLLRCVAAPQTALRLLGGALAMISAHRFAFGALVSLTAKIEAPCRETPTWSRSARGTPKLGGRDERSEERGACHALCTTLQRSSPMQNSLHASIAPLRETQTRARSASLPPISSVAPKWGAANAPSFHCYGAKTKPLHQRFTMAGAVCGGRRRSLRGACHAFCTTYNEAPQT